MKYPYYNPNLHLSEILSALIVPRSKADANLTAYYRKLTGKKYILITNSCRTALYLAWRCIGKKGGVVTSPLTCKVAVDPIIAADNIPIFADIRMADLTIDPEDIEHRITENTIAIQASHFGGYPCEMDQLIAICKKHNILLVEDCAQSLGATYKDQFTGFFGDISCFSLSKNAYGIGGGIFATNHKEYYENAKAIHEGFDRESAFMMVYRAIRNYLETNRSSFIWNLMLLSLLTLKGEKKNYQGVKDQLLQASAYQVTLAALQLKNLDKLHSKRIQNGLFYDDLIVHKKLNVLDYSSNHNNQSSYTKYFFYHPAIEYDHISDFMLKHGIEVMHLHQTNKSPKQERMMDEKSSLKRGLKHYHLIHDSVISLPLTEDMTRDAIQEIVELLGEELNV